LFYTKFERLRYDRLHVQQRIFNVTAIDLIAIIGALAWAPPVISWLKALLTRPLIRVITQPTPEIGYTPNGPIFNLRLALTATHRDVVITGMRVQIAHESGEQREFSWRGITQRMATMDNPQMGSIQFEKRLDVLAMKVTTKEVEERFVRFQDLDFLGKKAELNAAAMKRLAHCRQTAAMIDPAFTQSTEVVDLNNFVRESICWKAGTYKIKFLIESPDSFSIVDDEYSFALTPHHIQQLSSNLNHLARSYELEVLPKVGDEAAPPINWNWVYPEMKSTLVR
jgi:hypothetical protein